MFRPMAQTADLTRIQARRKSIAAEMAEIQQELEALTKEDNELAIAERVLIRLSLKSGAEEAAEQVTGEVSAAAEKEPSGGKPAGLPPVPDMILEALRHAFTHGAPGLEPNGILSYIKGRYWPEATTNKVGPIAWRMWKHDQLDKRGSIYRLPKEEREKILMAEPSQTTEAVEG